MTFRAPDHFQFSMSGDTEIYLWSHFDPIIGKNHMCEARVLESIRSHCQKSMFPVHVRCSEPSLIGIDLVDTIPVCARNTDSPKNWPQRGHYQYFISKDCSQIQIWDTENAAYGELYLSSMSHNRLRLLFKGVEIEKPRFSFRQPYINGMIDLYGLDTKETISLDRSSLTSEGSKQAYKIAFDLFSFYKDCVIELLCSDNTDDIFSSTRFNLYAFWRACDYAQQGKIPEKLLESNVTEKAIVITRATDKLYRKTLENTRTLIPFRPETCFLNIGEFRTFQPGPSFDFPKMLSILNQAASLSTEKIIVDEDLVQASKSLWLRTVELPVPGENLLLYTVSPQEGTLLTAGGSTRKEILLGLSQPIKGFDYSLRSDNPPKRYAIPALKEYSSLYLEGIPYGIIAPVQYNFYYIIAPFDREQAKKVQEMNKEAFVSYVLDSSSFSSVVSFVLDHSPQCTHRTQEEITNAYKELLSEYYDCAHLENNK